MILFIFLFLISFQKLQVIASEETGVSLNSEQSDFSVDGNFCKDKLNEEIDKLIKDDDSEILMNSFNIASFKLAYKVLKNNGEGQTLEEHTKTKIKELKEADKNNLREKVTALYKKFGRSKSLNEVSQIIDNLDKHNYFPKSERLSNADSAVLMMAYEYIDPCQNSMMCINENDTAIVWFMDEVANKVEKDTGKSELGNLLRTTVKIAHNTGVFSNTDALSLDQIKKHVSDLNKKNTLIIKFFNERFHQKYEDCLELLGGASCFAQEVNKVFQSRLNNVLSELQHNTVKSIPNPLRIQLMEGMRLNLSKNLTQNKKKEPIVEASYPTKLNLPLEIVDGDKPFTCGGKSFEAESKLKHIFSFDPLRLWSNIKSSKTPWKDADRLAERKQNAINHKASRGNKAAALMSLFNRFCPKIPLSLGPVFWFKCDTFMKWLVVRHKTAEAKVCCKDKVQWKEYSNLFLGSTGGVEGKIFVGIPNLAEFGGMLGLSTTLNVGGGAIPEGCYEKKCISGSVIPSIYGGLYLNIGIKDTLKSAIGGEAKVAWKPYASLRQCLYPSGNLPKAQLKLSMGSIYLQGTVYAGWVFSYDFYKMLWESKKEDTFDIAIF